MAKSMNLKPQMLISFFIMALLVVSVEARPLMPAGRSPVNKGIEILFEGLYVEGIKTGGPSSGGGGHNFPFAQTTLGGIKNSGPSTGGGGH
ncbi:hypothetical protein TIFTF001_005051 [Ficus carica]|uniref:Transmembrane protein n=1 Tax=Ficus carica TaxID=3494 RepID=A0AA88A6F7_FICCA|nr:hypothetical protein TIFTF001_005051 [Ficus carica]